MTVRRPDPDERERIVREYEEAGHRLRMTCVYDDRGAWLEAMLRRDEEDAAPDGMVIPADEYVVICLCGEETTHPTFDDAIWWVREHLVCQGMNPQHWIKMHYLPRSAEDEWTHRPEAR